MVENESNEAASFNEEEAQVTAEESQAIEMVESESNEEASTNEQEVTYKKVQVYGTPEDEEMIEFESEVTYSSTYGSFEAFVFLQNGVGAFYGSHTISEDGKTFMLDIPKSTLEDPFYVGGTGAASMNSRMLEYVIFANMPESIFTIVACVIIMIVLTTFVNKTKAGKAMRAVSEDNGAAQLMGINVNQSISLTFAIGSGLAAVAGVLMCSAYPVLMPTTGAMPGIKAFTAAVFGGIGSIPGAMVGGLI